MLFLSFKTNIMAKKKNNVTEEQFAAVENTLSKTEQWVENNYKSLLVWVGAIVAVILLISLINSSQNSSNIEAQDEMFVSVNYFEKDSFNLALSGDGQYSGFLDIIDDYGNTKTGNLANYYAGACYLNLGDNDNAIKFLSKFDANDEIVSSVALGSLGDAYMNIGETDKAISSWKKAANNSENSFTSPLYLLRAAMALEDKGNYSQAIELYQKIKANYSKSDQGSDIDKYITRASLKQ
jgi:tetratricopeptide (TPR) repeat protein